MFVMDTIKRHSVVALIDLDKLFYDWDQVLNTKYKALTCLIILINVWRGTCGVGQVGYRVPMRVLIVLGKLISQFMTGI